MARTSSNKETRLSYDKTRFNSPLIEVEKIVHAPVEKVWKTWTTPELFKLWNGPAHFSCPEAQMNFKKGGSYLHAMKDNVTGQLVWSTGIFEQIVPLEKIVFTDHFSNEKGGHISAQDAGIEGEWPEVLYVTVQFEARTPFETKVSITHEGVPESANQDCAEGWRQMLNKFARLAEIN